MADAFFDNLMANRSKYKWDGNTPAAPGTFAAFSADPFGVNSKQISINRMQSAVSGMLDKAMAPDWTDVDHQSASPAQFAPIKPAPPQPLAPQDNSNPFAGRYGGMDQRLQVQAMQAAIDRQSAIDKRRSNLENLTFTRQANPYADGNAGLMGMKAGFAANSANQFARSNQAFGDDLAARGLSMNDGLAQNQAQAMRMNEATSRAGGLNALDAENYGRQVAFDQNETQAQRAFDANKAAGLDAFSTGNYQLGDQLSRTAFDMGSSAQRQPYELQGLGLANAQTQQRINFANQEQPYRVSGLQQGLRAGDQQYAQGQQQLTAGDFANRQAGRIDQIGQEQQGDILGNIRDRRAFYEKNKGMYDYLQQAQLDGAMNTQQTEAMLGYIPGFGQLASIAKTPTGQTIIGAGMKLYGGGAIK